VANAAIPCSKGHRPLAVSQGGAGPLGRGRGCSHHAARQARAADHRRSHDPLLEWALRESGSGLATLPEGSEAGLRRLARGEVMAAAIHLHRIEGGDDDSANADAVANAPGLHDVVVLTFARREQGLLVAPGNPLKLSDIGSAAAAHARMALRPNAPAPSSSSWRCWRTAASCSRH